MVLFCSAYCQAQQILGDYTSFCKSTHRFTLAPELHPDWMLMLFFAHTHLTVTVTLGLLLVPKVNPQISFHSLIICQLKSNFTESLKYLFCFPQFLFAGTQLRDDIATEAYEDELDMGRSGSYLNSSITSAWSEHSLDPEDIRVGALLSFLLPFPLESLLPW